MVEMVSIHKNTIFDELRVDPRNVSLDCGQGSFGLGYGQVAGYCENGNDKSS
jgi:hypothetical protein